MTQLDRVLIYSSLIAALPAALVASILKSHFIAPFSIPGGWLAVGLVWATIFSLCYRVGREVAAWQFIERN